MSTITFIKRSHQAYASNLGDGYQAACHDCGWRGEIQVVYKYGSHRVADEASFARLKQAAREEGSSHERAAGDLFEVPCQVFDAEPLAAAVSTEEDQ